MISSILTENLIKAHRKLWRIFHQTVNKKLSLIFQGSFFKARSLSNQIFIERYTRLLTANRNFSIDRKLKMLIPETCCIQKESEGAASWIHDWSARNKLLTTIKDFLFFCQLIHQLIWLILKGEWSRNLWFSRQKKINLFANFLTCD